MSARLDQTSSCTFSVRPGHSSEFCHPAGQLLLETAAPNTLPCQIHLARAGQSQPTDVSCFRQTSVCTFSVRPVSGHSSKFSHPGQLLLETAAPNTYVVVSEPCSQNRAKYQRSDILYLCSTIHYVSYIMVLSLSTISRNTISLQVLSVIIFNLFKISSYRIFILITNR